MTVVDLPTRHERVADRPPSGARWYKSTTVYALTGADRPV
jgi:hypothetical protein